MSEEIASELHKLEITISPPTDATTIPQQSDGGTGHFLDTANLPLELNPFYEDEIATKDFKCNDNQLRSSTVATITMQRNQLPGCRRCRLRRRSEGSVGDAYKSDPQTMLLNSVPTCVVGCWTHSTLGGVQQQSIKHRRRNILRPPLLRKLQNLQTLLQVMPASENNSEKLVPLASVSGSTATTLSAKVTPISSQAAAAKRGICDFRDLMHECENLLEMENDVKGRFGLVSPDQRLNKHFTTMQQLTKSPRGVFSCKKEIFTPTVDPTQQQSSPERSIGNVCSRSPPTASTSCSQQAGNSAAVAAAAASNGSGGGSSGGDDVTIDELASYFDTFVHIPKKMSTMAEMMYI